MFDCARCGNTGQITEAYVDPLSLEILYGPDAPPVINSTVEVKTRLRECPRCLGFSAVPLRHKRG
jgi:ribosomal protein S27AE